METFHVWCFAFAWIQENREKQRQSYEEHKRQLMKEEEKLNQRREEELNKRRQFVRWVFFLCNPTVNHCTLSCKDCGVIAGLKAGVLK